MKICNAWFDWNKKKQYEYVFWFVILFWSWIWCKITHQPIKKYYAKSDLGGRKGASVTVIRRAGRDWGEAGLGEWRVMFRYDGM